METIIAIFVFIGMIGMANLIQCGAECSDEDCIEGYSEMVEPNDEETM